MTSLVLLGRRYGSHIHVHASLAEYLAGKFIPVTDTFVGRQNTLEKYFIVRISWVFGVNGKNFIKTMLNLGKTALIVGLPGSGTFAVKYIVRADIDHLAV